jgi:hypothetical protein
MNKIKIKKKNALTSIYTKIFILQSPGLSCRSHLYHLSDLRDALSAFHIVILRGYSILRVLVSGKLTGKDQRDLLDLHSPSRGENPEV